MIIYLCEDRMSLDQAIRKFGEELLNYGYRRLSPTMIGFRKKPCRRSKEILSRYGITRYTHSPEPTTPDQVEALARKFQP